jgi:nicotinate-nucleotide adenylyltransferase
VSCAPSSTSWRATDTSALESRAGEPALGPLGILGGTFNPPHLGHLAIALSALRELELQRVVLMPARIPPHKPVAADPGPLRRLEMCRLLLDGVDGLSTCALELEREGPSYTVDTLSAIAASHPDCDLTLIVGADIARTLPAWREPEKLLGLASVAVAERTGTGREQVRAALDTLDPPARIRFLDAPLLDVSSSLARDRAAAGEPLDDVVGAGVAGYIAEQGLYGAAGQVR